MIEVEWSNRKQKQFSKSRRQHNIRAKGAERQKGKKGKKGKRAKGQKGQKGQKHKLIFSAISILHVVVVGGGQSLGTNKNNNLISGRPLTTIFDIQVSWVLIFNHFSAGGSDQEWVKCERNQGNISHGRLPPLHILQQVAMWLSLKKK